jgi:hypothetical protein
MDLSFKKENDFRTFTAGHSGNVLGFISVDSTIRGHVCGGSRKLPENNEAEIRSSARTMAKV